MTRRRPGVQASREARLKLNADIRQPARVFGGEQPWTASPLPGVERRMLERDGDEVARVTSIVRYAPGSAFSPHVHGGGEEFYVLDGVFGDEHGDFPAGTYVRNPVGSAHTPRCASGCTIFVKLRWMQPQDQTFVNLQVDSVAWTDVAAHRELVLHRFAPETTLLVDLPAGAALAGREVPGGEELFVISGRARDDTSELPAYTWIRTPPGSASGLVAIDDCRLYFKRGHLGTPPPRHTA